MPTKYKSELKTCVQCGKERKIHVKRNVCYPCKYKKYDRGRSKWERTKKYHENYYRRNPLFLKYKAYRHSDKIKGRETITLQDFNNLIETHPYCFYCEANNLPELGLDRLDNNGGHSITNVVVCCEKCNNLLSDIPYEAKLLLKDGLKQIHKRGLLSEWVVPTKRKS